MSHIYQTFLLHFTYHIQNYKEFLWFFLFNLARSELFSIRFRLPGSLARWLAGYEIFAFEKPCLHDHKISTEFKPIYTRSKWKRTNRRHSTIYGIFYRKIRTKIGTKFIMGDIMRMRRLIMLITSV